MIFDSLVGLGRVILFSILAYAFLVLILRFSGKRALAKLNAFDFAVTVAFGSTLATVLLSKQVALAEGVLAFVMLGLLQWIVARLSVSSAWFGRLVRSDAAVLFVNGQYREVAMHRERVIRSEIDAAIRKGGYARSADVGAVILETDGTLSVIPRAEDGDMLKGVRD